MLTRRAALATLLATTAIRPGLAQSFPTRPITIIVPYPTDVLARLVAQHAPADLGQPIQVDNRGGGAGVIGSVVALRAEPDGHTLRIDVSFATLPTVAAQVDSGDMKALAIASGKRSPRRA
jgi:tripartite-type tricarboxylate transporter receptor subunit TctC